MTSKIVETALSDLDSEVCSNIVKGFKMLLQKYYCSMFDFVKIVSSNACEPTRFSDASVIVEHSTRIDDPDCHQGLAFYVLMYTHIDSIYEKFLKKFDTDSDGDPEDSGSLGLGTNAKELNEEQLHAFLHLIDFMNKKDLRNFRDNLINTDNEKIIAIHFAIELFSPLLGKKVLLGGKESRNIKCKCTEGCTITYDQGDTSIGHLSTWHGPLDVVSDCGVGICTTALRADNVDDNVDNDDKVNFDNVDLNDVYLEPVSLKKMLDPRDKSQIYAQSLTFAFVQDPDVVPFIGTMAKGEQIVFLIYDKKNDILLTSKGYSLFLTTDRVDWLTVICLWFIMHYHCFPISIPDVFVTYAKELGLNANVENALGDKYHLFRDRKLEIGGVSKSSLSFTNETMGDKECLELDNTLMRRWIDNRIKKSIKKSN